MSISELGKEVKEKIRISLSSLNKYVSLPNYKFLLEMVSGILSTQSVNLIEIGSSLKEEVNIKHTHKRLCRNVKKNGNMLEVSNNYLLKHTRQEIDEASCIYLDGGDITYSFANRYENMGIVRDGSTGNLKSGYPNNLIVCKNSNGLVFPLYFNIYHRQVGYISDNAETLQAINKVIEYNGNKGIWVLDRGYDRRVIIDELINNNCKFIIRMVGRRHLLHKDSNQLVLEIANNNPLKYHYRGGKYHFQQCRYNETAVTLVYYNKCNVDMILMVSGSVKDRKDIENSINLYLSRWSVEDGHRFIKQAFGIEKARTSLFESTKCIVAMALLAWYILYKISKDRLLKEYIYKEAKTYNPKTVKFDYYRLVRGVRNILRMCKEMFRFRKRYKENTKHQMTIDDLLAKFDKTVYIY